MTFSKQITLQSETFKFHFDKHLNVYIIFGKEHEERDLNKNVIKWLNHKLVIKACHWSYFWSYI